MARVILEAEAAEQLLQLPARIKDRMAKLLARLEDWPEESGVKALRGKLAGR